MATKNETKPKQYNGNHKPGYIRLTENSVDTKCMGCQYIISDDGRYVCTLNRVCLKEKTIYMKKGKQ